MPCTTAGSWWKHLTTRYSTIIQLLNQAVNSQLVIAQPPICRTHGALTATTTSGTSNTMQNSCLGTSRAVEPTGFTPSTSQSITVVT